MSTCNVSFHYISLDLDCSIFALLISASVIAFLCSFRLSYRCSARRVKEKEDKEERALFFDDSEATKPARVDITWDIDAGLKALHLGKGKFQPQSKGDKLMPKESAVVAPVSFDEQTSIKERAQENAEQPRLNLDADIGILPVQESEQGPQNSIIPPDLLQEPERDLFEGENDDTDDDLDDDVEIVAGRV